MQEHDQPEENFNKSRRDFVKKLPAVTAGVALLGSFAGCAEPEAPEMLVGTLAELKEKGALTPKFNGKRIFATYLEDELVVFSLICRHKKCTVEWQDTEQEFHCPCHEGVYDATGQVLDGPPKGPLYRFKHEVRGEEIWVLNEYLPSA